MPPLFMKTVNKEIFLLVIRTRPSKNGYFQFVPSLVWMSSLTYLAVKCFNPVARGLYENILFISICSLSCRVQSDLFFLLYISE